MQEQNIHRQKHEQAKLGTIQRLDGSIVIMFDVWAFSFPCDVTDETRAGEPE